MHNDNREQRRSLCLLLVDDNRTARAGLRALLESVAPNANDFEIVEADDGVQAIEMVEAHRPEVVLMDVQMPRLNGIEATRIIKARWPAIRVIVLTMYSTHQADALAAGADEFLLKGSPSDRLLDAIFHELYPPKGSPPKEQSDG